MTIETSLDVFFDQLKDLKSATAQTTGTFPDLIGWSSNPALRGELIAYAGETTGHMQEILAIFEHHSMEPEEDRCEAMAGLIRGGNAHLAVAADAVRDHLLIAHVNRIGRYLQGASEFTLAMARKCELSAEVEAVGGILESHRKFIRSLAAVGSRVFGIEMWDAL